MQSNISYQQCLSFINCQLNPAHPSALPPLPAITLSRMSGSGGHTVASSLAEHLQARAPAPGGWTVFDRNLMEQVIEDHHLDKRIADYLPEAHKSMIDDILEELLALHPATWTLVRKVSETILRLTQMGHVIIVGRGASVVTRTLPNTFHVRLVGSIERRIERVAKANPLDPRAARDLIRKEDQGRRRYLKDHFGEDIDNPLLYHLVINTDGISGADAARLISDEVIHRFQLN